MSLDLIPEHLTVDEKAQHILSNKVSEGLLPALVDVWYCSQRWYQPVNYKPVTLALEFDIKGSICVKKGIIIPSSKRAQVTADNPGYWQHVVNPNNGCLSKGIFARQTQDGRVLVVTSLVGVYDLLQYPGIKKLGHKTSHTRLPIYAAYPKGHHTHIAIANIDTLNATI